MSLRAIVRPASIVICVDLPFFVPSVRVGVNVTTYVIDAALALVMRTSDWNGPVAPFTCVTTGMTSALPGGMDLPPGVTGVTRLTDTGTLPIDAPLFVFVTLTVPVFAPGGRSLGLTVTVTVVPFGPTVPEGGLAVM